MALSYDPRLGPYAVGVVDGEVVDTHYPPIRETEAAGRRLLLRAWYPALAEGPPRGYLDDGDEDLVRAFFDNASGLLPVGWLDELRAVTTYSSVGAVPAEGRFPTLLYSHGALSWVGQNTPLMEHLASQGYVVLSIGHSREAAAVRARDGAVQPSDPAFLAAMTSQAAASAAAKLAGSPADRLAATRQSIESGPVTRWAQRWVDDQRAVLDALASGRVTGPAADLVATCDLDRVGVLGMSFGGAAAVSAAQQDKRVKAVVNIDGGQFLDDVLDTDIRLPLLYLSHDFLAALRAKGFAPEGELSIQDHNEFFYEPVSSLGQRTDIHRLRIAGVAHMELTDLALLPVEERRAVFADGGSHDGQRIVDILNVLTAGYFDQVLRGEDNGFPAAQLADLPEVSALDLSVLRG